MTTDAMTAMRQCPFFEEFQPKHMEKLMALGTEMRFRQDEVIFDEDDDPDLFYIILSGRVSLEATRHGRVFPVQTLYAMEELGWTAVLNRKREFRARAMEPVTAMAFEVAQLREVCRNNPYFGCAFLEKLFTAVAESLQQTRLRLVKVLAESGASKH